MSVTPLASSSPTHVIGDLEFQADLFSRAMAERGHKTIEAQARAAGLSKMTLHRWRKGPIRQTPLNAHQAAHVSGLTVDQLFTPVASAAA